MQQDPAISNALDKLDVWTENTKYDDAYDVIDDIVSNPNFTTDLANRLSNIRP